MQKYNNKYLKAYILAGGKSKRMQENKAHLKYKKKTFLEHIIICLKSLTSDITILKGENQYPQIKLPQLSDTYIDKGPIGAIYTGLSKSSSNTLNLFVSCDNPCISKNLLNFLIEKSQPNKINLFSKQDELFYFPFICNTRQIQIFNSQLKNINLKLKDTFNMVGINVISCPQNLEKHLFNINTKTDLNNLINEN